jgi:phosphoserine phosphatase
MYSAMTILVYFLMFKLQILAVFKLISEGYGCSTGTPSEKNLYADIAAALNALSSRYQISPEQVILYGQSIGTVPSIGLRPCFT